MTVPTSGPIIGPVDQPTAAFLAAAMPVVVGTRRRTGEVKLTPAWYEYRDGCFWLNTRRGAHWLDHIERDRSATLLVIDPADPHRVVHAETRLVQTTIAGALEQVNRLSQRYLGQPYRLAFPQQRVLVQLEPVRLRSALDGRPGRPE